MHLLDDAVVVGLAHEALERRERAGREHVEIGELARRKGHDLERVEILGCVAGAIDERAAVRRDQTIRRLDRHAVTLAGTRPSCSSAAMTCAADSSGSRPSVSTTISALLRRLVRIVDPGEALDLSGERLRIEPVHVATSAFVERRADVDLDERAVLLDERASVRPCLLVGRDRRDDDGAAVSRDARCNPAEPLDVRVAILLREAEPLREVRAHRVAVEVLDDEAAAIHLRADVMRDRRLARAGETGEPEGEATASVGLRLGVLVRVDVLTHVVLSSVVDS